MARVSRRNFLKTGGALLVSPLLSDLTSLSRLSLVTGRTRIYIGADDHTDYFWTGSEEDYRQWFVEMLDYYLDLADKTANEPTEYQMRWNCDGSYWIRTYEQNKPPADFERLIKRIRDGHISFPLNALVVCLGGSPTEAVLRGMYYAGKLERRHNFRVPIAIAMENQTLAFGLTALWAGSGAKYSWKGICGCDTLIPDAGNREHEIYWAVGPDDSRILMKWYSGGSSDLGGYAEARETEEVIEFVDTDHDFKEHRYPYQVIGIFGKGFDDQKTFTSFTPIARAKTNAKRQVIVSNMEDFFQDFETTYGDQLPSVACSFGNEWDTYCTAIAEISASVKRSVEKLRNAEALAVLVSLQDPSFMTGRDMASEQAWMNLGLYWEHDLGVVGRFDTFGKDRIDWQRRLAREIKDYVDNLGDDATKALAEMIPKGSSAARFYVFNALSWTHSDVADLSYSDPELVHVIDLTTNFEVPSQIVMIGDKRFLRILAADVPPVGYKVFEVRSGRGRKFSDAATVTGNILETPDYRVAVAGRGAITSLVDRTREDQEFARIINGRFINDLGPGNGTLRVENVGPVSVTLSATGRDPLAHTSFITLIRGVNRIDIRNEITQNFSDIFTWAFGFDLVSPDVWHEEVGAVMRAKLLSAGGQYATRNARYDWLTLNHFADMSGSDGVGVTLSNADCYFMKLGSSTPENLDVNTPQISALAGGRVGGDGSGGIPAQAGDSYFLQRFALRTHAAYDPVDAMRFAMEHQNPLVTANVIGGKDVYPETCYSSVTISNPNVLLWALKPAEDGIENGIIARVWNLASAPADFSLRFTSGPIRSAQQTTHIETPVAGATLENGALSGSLTAQQIKTFAVSLKS